MTRTAVLIDDRDKRLGRVRVPDLTFVVQHQGEIFVRTDRGIRLSGGGIGVIFQLTDPLVRDRLDPA